MIDREAVQEAIKRETGTHCPNCECELPGVSAADAAIAEIFRQLAEPGKEMLVAGISAADDAMDCDTSSNADGDRYEYQYLRSDAPAEIWQAMLAAAKP